jgi:hypothetical protein
MAFGGDGIEFNICDTIAPNIYFFANRSLDKLFKASDILAGSIEPTGAGGFPALEQEKINLLKRALQIRFSIKDADFLKIWVDIKSRLNCKCHDARKKNKSKQLAIQI